MPIYRIADDKIVSMKTTTFGQEGLKERQDLQRMLKDNISVLSPDDEILVVAEEYSNWEDSKRRIDLLGIDKRANLVVIELKRTEDGGHMDLQAIRYAAMISTLTFDDLVSAYSEYLVKSESEKDAEGELLKFLEWEKPLEEKFGQEVKIILASADFSKELTTSVIWLNDSDLDIRCVRLQPYESKDGILLDVQTLIPIREAADYQMRKKGKEQKERESARSSGRDLTKYNVRVAGGELHEKQYKNRAMLHLVSGVLRNGGTPERIEEITKRDIFKSFDGELDAQQIREAMPPGRYRHYFTKENEIFRINGKTYLLRYNVWGPETIDYAQTIQKEFPKLNIEFTPSD